MQEKHPNTIGAEDMQIKATEQSAALHTEEGAVSATDYS